MVNNLNPEDLIKSIWALQMTRKEQWLHYNQEKKIKDLSTFFFTSRAIILKTKKEERRNMSALIYSCHLIYGIRLRVLHKIQMFHLKSLFTNIS